MNSLPPNLRVALYRDSGVFFPLADSLYRRLRRWGWQVQRVQASFLVEEEWESQFDLLIFPGGRDVPYQRKLSGKGNRKIISFVRGGGKFLGICAGAYYACGKILFAQGTPLQVIEERELGFFPGQAVGPLGDPHRFSYIDLHGIQAVPLSCRPPFSSLYIPHLYYHGGCTFLSEKKEDFASISILATYPEWENQPALIAFSYGRGGGILCSVHLEYLLEEDIQNLRNKRADLFPLLQSSRILSEQLFEQLFLYLF